MTTTARDFFERARAASQDAERCARQLDGAEARALAVGGGGFEPRVRSSPDPQRMERRADAHMDRERMLRSRMEADYELIDRACVVLYGANQDGRGGVCAEASPVWADVLWWRYLADAKWSAVADAVGYSSRPCQQMCAQALEWIDEAGFMADVMDAG